MRALNWRRHLRQWTRALGIVALGYVAGAAAIFFGLPTADFLERAFIGGSAWYAQKNVTGDAPSGAAHFTRSAPPVDEPSKTCDGFTLYSCVDADGRGGAAYLIDMRGEQVHRWLAPYAGVSLYKSVKEGQVAKIHNYIRGLYGLHLDGDGSLLAVLHGTTPLGGSVLIKVDKESRLLWHYAGPVHHDIDVGEDGRIYAIETDMLATAPDVPIAAGAEPFSDRLLVLSAQGELLLPPISILDALVHSPYAMLVSASDPPHDPESDLLHTNFVHLLRPRPASRFRTFKAGQVLLSMRRINTIAVLDIGLRSVVWAARGPWRGQHDAQFLDNGHLLIFDNCGPPAGSRVIEYDPETGAFPWWFSGTSGKPLATIDRGMAQRLPNGNTLVVDADDGELMEIGADRRMVWRYSTGRFTTTARRYAPADLKFLGGRDARP